MKRAKIIIQPRSSHPSWVVDQLLGVECDIKSVGPVQGPKSQSRIDYVSFDRQEVVNQVLAFGPEGRSAVSWLSQNTLWDSLEHVIFPVTCVAVTSF